MSLNLSPQFDPTLRGWSKTLKPTDWAALSRAALAMTCVVAFSPAYGAHLVALPADPADPNSAVPPTSYKSVLPGAEQAYLREVDAQRLPWRSLFTPDGSFVPEEQLRGTQSVSAVPAPSDAPKTLQAPSSGGSDARAIIRSINIQQGKVKLKHGPIERLGMPGMTMVFRVKDPAILKQVQEGEEVGVTIEMDGSRFFVTGFQK